MKPSRKPTLATLLLGLALTSSSIAQDTNYFQNFSVPETRYSRNGVLDTQLTADFSEVVIQHPDGNRRIVTRVYENMVPGPTLRVMPGDSLRVAFRNYLLPPPDYQVNDPQDANLSNLHTHGLHVYPGTVTNVVGGVTNILASDDVLVTVVPPGYTNINPEVVAHGPNFTNFLQYQVDVPIYHAPGTHWYHAHRHGSVGIQVQNGMAGALIVDEPTGQEIAPGLREQVMVIQQVKNFGEFEGGTGEIKGVNETLETINGLYQPTLFMHPGEVQRWRIVNAGSNVPGYNIFALVDSTGNSLPFTLVAYDGITLAAPVTMTSVFMAPGNRADIIVQMPKPQMLKSAVAGVHYYDPQSYNIVMNPTNFYGGVFGYSSRSKTYDSTNSIPTYAAPPVLDTNSTAQPKIAGTRHVWRQISKKTTTQNLSLGNDQAAAQETTTTYTVKYKVPNVQTPTVLGQVNSSGLMFNHQSVPETLPQPTAAYVQRIQDNEILKRRVLTFDVDFKRDPKWPGNTLLPQTGPNFLIDNQSWTPTSPVVPTIYVPFQSVEEWTIINNSDMSHPFHIHVNPFQVMEVGMWMGYKTDNPSDPTDASQSNWMIKKFDSATARWQDTLNLPPRGWVKIRSRFLNFEGTYVLHCHILNHEDQGMMWAVQVGEGSH